MNSKRGKSSGKVLVRWKLFFLVKLVKWDKYYWKQLLLKISHIPLNNIRWYFKAFSLEIYKNLSIRSIKWLSQKNQKITQKAIFYQRVRKGENPEERFWFDGNNFFWSNQWNVSNNTENSFAHQYGTHTAKLSSSVVMKHFRWWLPKKFSLSTKKWHIRKMLWIT